MLFYGAVTFTIFCTLLLLCAPWLLRPHAEVERLLQVVQSSRKDQRTIGRREHVQDVLLAQARKLRERLGFAENVQITQRLIAAGFRGENAGSTFFAAQSIGVILGGVLGSFMASNVVFWILTGMVVGFMAPDFWLTAKGKKRRDKIRRSIPDAIDLLVICVDAGLGLDQALLRVVEELDVSHPEINQEFSRINLEQRAGTPRVEAWGALAQRTQIDEFTSFVTMLTQTERFGTPIVKALTTFSEEIRLKRKQRAEEAAAKTKIKIIFPLVFCIFPCIFIVLLAPAMLSIASGFHSMGN